MFRRGPAQISVKDEEGIYMGTEQLQGLIGPALVIGFVVILVLCVIADKNANKKFLKKIENKYKIKDKLGQIQITEDNEILMYLPSGTLAGYKLFKLSEIFYIGMNTIPTKASMNMLAYCFMDAKKKPMKGEYLTPSRKQLLQKKMTTFSAANQKELDEIYEFVKKYLPNVGKVVNGKEV